MGILDRIFKRSTDSKAEINRAGHRMQRGRLNSNAPYERVDMSPQELAYLYRYNRLVRRILNVQTGPATRGLPQFSGKHATEYTNLFNETGIMQGFKRAINWALLFGHGAILYNWDDRLDLSTPLQHKRASRLVNFTVYDRRTIKPLDIAAGPQSEFFTLTSLNENIGKVHRSRIAFFDGEDLDELARIANGGGGESMINQISNAISAISGGWENTAYALEVFSLLDYAIEDLDNLMAQDSRGVQSKIDFLDRWRHLSRLFAHDAKDKIQYQSMNLSNFDKTFEILLERLSIETGLPLVYLIGRSAAGTLGESGRSEREQLTFLVQDLRSEKMDRPMSRALSDLSLIYKWELPEYEYPPVLEPDAERQAKIKQLTAATDAANINAGIYGAKTAQQRYKGEFSTEITIHPDEDLEFVDDLTGDPDKAPSDQVV